MHVLSPDQVRAARRWAPRNRDRADVRIYAAGMTLLFLAGLLVPAFYLLTATASPILKVVLISTARVPPQVWGLAFLVAALLTMPHLWTLVFAPDQLGHVLPRKLACMGSALGCMLYLVIGGNAAPLDLGVAPWTYYAKAFGCIFVGTIYALSLNAQQVRDNEKSAVVR